MIVTIECLCVSMCLRRCTVLIFFSPEKTHTKQIPMKMIFVVFLIHIFIYIHLPIPIPSTWLMVAQGGPDRVLQKCHTEGNFLCAYTRHLKSWPGPFWSKERPGWLRKTEYINTSTRLGLALTQSPWSNTHLYFAWTCIDHAEKTFTLVARNSPAFSPQSNHSHDQMFPFFFLFIYLSRWYT